ncbi:MAG: MmcQ/YjbR family DNA-binding protein [Leeuwenhoekiella sp.]
MNIEQYREYCIAKPGTTEEFPFDKDTLVFKIMGKMYALASLSVWESGDARINLKCDPDKSLRLREKYPDTILPGYHMSKIHWNTVHVNQDLSPRKIKELIDHSYDLIVQSLTKKLKEQLAQLK